jgi:hypothetical protein
VSIRRRLCDAVLQLQLEGRYPTYFGWQSVGTLEYSLFYAYIVTVMKLLYFALPLLGSLATAQSLVKNDCQCPQFKCPDTDTLASPLYFIMMKLHLTNIAGGM